MSKKFTKKLQKSISTMVMITTIVWMSGIAMIAPVEAAANEAQVADITGTSPRIAADYESGTGVLGINATRVDTTDVIKLNQVAVRFEDVSGTPSAKVRKVEILRDSSLSGTNGVYDSQDSIVGFAAQLAADAALTSTASTTSVTVLDADAVNLQINDWISLRNDADATSNGTSKITAKSSDSTHTTFTLSPALTAAVTGDILIEVTGSSGFGDTLTTSTTELNKAVTSSANFNIGDYVSVRDANALAVSLGEAQVTAVPDATHVTLDTAITTESGDYIVEIPGIINTTTKIAYVCSGLLDDVAKTDTGTDLGNDFFVRVWTDGATANNSFKVKINNADIHYYNVNTTSDFTVSSNGENNYTKVITVGSDQVAPSVNKIEIEDTNPDGVVDKAKIYFDESMSDAVTSSARLYVQNATTDTTNTTAGTVTSGTVFDLTSATKALAGEYLAGVTTTGALASGVGKLISSKSGSAVTLGAALTGVAAGDVILEVPSAAPAYVQLAGADDTWTAGTYVVNVVGQGMNVGTFHVGDYVAVVDASAKSVLKISKVTAITLGAAAGTITLADTFTWTPGNGDVLIEVAGYGLAAAGIWSTTTNVNDTYTVNIENFTLPYSGVTLNFGYYDNSTFNGIFGTGDKFKDASGTAMSETSGIATTDKAKPYAKKAWLYDNDGNGKIDELRVEFSEPLGSTSTESGFALKNTSLSPNKTYTLTGVNGFIKGSEAYAEANDTIKIAVQEESTDVSDNFTLNYTESSTGVADAVGNDAASATQVGGGNVSKSIKPIIKTITVKDAGQDGYIESATITFSCSATSSGAPVFTVAGYTGASFGAIAGSTTATLSFTAGSVYDTGVVPDITYIGSATNYIHCGDTNYKMDNIDSNTVIEQDYASPILISQTFYETGTKNSTWETGETIQLYFSEDIDPSTVVSSWASDTFADFSKSLSPAQSPDSGTIEVIGRVITLTASENATAVLTSSDYIRPAAAEIKDASANSAVTGTTFLTVNPTSAPSVAQVRTADLNGNGVVDALKIMFTGLIDASTIINSDFGAARSADFTTSNGSATSTNPVAPDLTISEIVTENGGNDSIVIVKFVEVGEDSGALPQVKYYAGSLSDLAGNAVSSFNVYSSDSAKFETTVTYAAYDYALPIPIEVRLKDRNGNNKYDQLMVTYSEAVQIDGGGATANGVLSSTGWAVADHTIAASGYVYDNVNTALTYATTNAVFKVDINEIAGNETAVPEVTYISSGITKDANNNLLASIADSDVTEVSEINIVPPVPPLADGDVARIDSAEEVYVIKLVGDLKFKRHIVSPMVFNSYGHLNWSMIQSVSSLDAYSLSAWVRVCTGPNGTPAATDKVYEVNADSTMHWLNMTAAQFYARGGSDEAIYNVNAGELGLYTLGVDVMYE